MHCARSSPRMPGRPCLELKYICIHIISIIIIVIITVRGAKMLEFRGTFTIPRSDFKFIQILGPCLFWYGFLVWSFLSQVMMTDNVKGIKKKKHIQNSF